MTIFDSTTWSFVTNLSAGVSYFLVTTGFANADAGTFTNFITCEGTITLGAAPTVPLPAALQLFAAGLTAMGFMGRKGY